MVTVRDATDGDVEAMAAIYDHLIATSDVIWYDEPLGVETFRTKIADHLRGPHPVLVAETDDEIVGYANYGPFRTLTGYATTVEHSIFVAAGHEGRGVGQRLLDELIDRARPADKTVMMAAIDGGNHGSIRFHQRNGFVETGRLPGVGRKKGRTRDLVLLQLDLTGAATAPSPDDTITSVSNGPVESGSVVAIDHVQLAMPAGGEDRARAFYRDLLGLPERPKPPNLATRGGCWFESDQVKIHLGVEADFRSARKAHPALRVRDLAALLATLGDADVPIVDDEPLEGHDRAYVDDPFGNRIELLEPRP